MKVNWYQKSGGLISSKYFITKSFCSTIIFIWGATDMNIDGYKEGVHKDLLISSTLDHGFLETPENCTQEDGFICGVFTLLMIMMGSKG